MINIKKKVSFFVRKPRKLGNFSIINYYENLILELSNEFNVTLHVLPFYSSGFFPRLFNCFYAFLNQSDINHVFGDVHYITIFLRKKRTILTILDCISFNSNKGIKKFIFKWIWFKIPIMKSKYVTTISNSVKKEIINNFNIKEEKVKKIYFSIFIDEKLKELKKPQPQFIFKILHIGSAPNKNIRNLAFGLKGLKNIELTILGKLSSIDKQILINLKINFIEIDKPLTDREVYDLYENCDLVSLISLYEGFGLPILEGNYFKKPVITSNISSMPEVAGNSAFLVDPKNPVEINIIINKIINKSFNIELHINNGIENLKRFNFSTQVTMYSELYKKLFNE